MTRENKLALIVGFGLVLFMGILVSDHLSTARRQAAAAFEVGTGLHHQPVIPGDGWLVYGSSTSAEEPVESAPINRSPSRQPAPLPIADTQTDSPLHVVATGETLQTICQRHYGNRNLAPALASYNRIANPDRLTTNTRLLLPPVDTLLSTGGNLPTTPPSPTLAATRSSSESSPAPVEAPANTMGEYTVQSGDTLSEIAQKLLGSARETERLYELNRDVLSHKDDLRVGASLRYPLSN
ncbi:MAG: LysM peptidoglycan-binding domain-containing protein [Phycisphaerales bacterium]|nr:LysM peptidoglycan-binding domain-containing protein [Phycisphaerales bacterium]